MSRPAVLPLKIDALPERLRKTPRWLLWRYELEAGTWRKKPKRADGRGNASSTGPDTWSTFEEACDAYLTGDYDGLGFIITGDDGIVGVDLDDHVLDGALDDLAQQTVQSMAGYWEISPSGNGIKGLVVGHLDRSRANHDLGIEVYAHGRYFAITGHAIRNDLGLDQTEQLASFVAERLGARVAAPVGEDDDEDLAAFVAWDRRRKPLDGWTIDRVKDEVLPHLDPEGYADWIKVGQALHHQFEGSGDALELWDEWSARSGKWVEGVCEQRWDTFDSTRPGGVSLGSLLHETSTAREQAEANKAEARVQGALDKIKASATTAELERQTAPELAKHQWSDGERARLVKAMQDRFFAISAARLPIADARRWLEPPAAGPVLSPGAPDWLSRWVYVTQEKIFFDLDRKVCADARAFDALHTDKMPLRQGSTTLREPASLYAVHAWGVRTVDYTMYAPPKPEVFHLDGGIWANTYDASTAPACEPGGEDVIRMVESYLRRQFPDDRERGVLLSWLAHNVRRPGVKVRWAPYVFGIEGAGKSFLAELLELTMGGPNVKRIDGKTLAGDFTGWAAGRAVSVIEEVRQMGHFYDVPEALKAPITNDKINVHRKGMDDFEAPNFTNYIILSNHADGIPITETDRRYFFLKTAMGLEETRALSEEGYFSNLFDACRAAGGQLRRWLMEEVVIHPDFVPNGRAPITETRAMVIELVKTEPQLVVEDLLIGRDAVSAGFVSSKLRAAGIEAKTRTLAGMLSRLGFEYAARLRIDGERQRIWVRTGKINHNDEEAIRAACSWMTPSEFAGMDDDEA